VESRDAERCWQASFRAGARITEPSASPSVGSNRPFAGGAPPPGEASLGDVDERRLHARQHLRHASLVDVADDAPPQRRRSGAAGPIRGRRSSGSAPVPLPSGAPPRARRPGVERCRHGQPAVRSGPPRAARAAGRGCLVTAHRPVRPPACARPAATTPVALRRRCAGPGASLCGRGLPAPSDSSFVGPQTVVARVRDPPRRPRTRPGWGALTPTRHPEAGAWRGLRGHSRPLPPRRLVTASDMEIRPERGPRPFLIPPPGSRAEAVAPLQGPGRARGCLKAWASRVAEAVAPLQGPGRGLPAGARGRFRPLRSARPARQAPTQVRNRPGRCAKRDSSGTGSLYFFRFPAFRSGSTYPGEGNLSSRRGAVCTNPSSTWKRD